VLFCDRVGHHASTDSCILCGWDGPAPGWRSPAFSYHFCARLLKKFMTYAQKQASFFDRMKCPDHFPPKDMINLSY
jgi:hypothetical protein